MGEGRGLSGKQRRVLQHLAEGKTRREAAKEAGVSERVVYNWLRDPVFREELQNTEDELWAATISGLRSGVRRSLDYLLKTVDNELIEPSLRLQAAKTLLTTALRVLELAELNELRERIIRLEERFGGNHETRTFTTVAEIGSADSDER